VNGYTTCGSASFFLDHQEYRMPTTEMFMSSSRVTYKSWSYCYS